MHPLIEHYLSLPESERKEAVKEFADYFLQENLYQIQSDETLFISTHLVPGEVLAKKTRGYILDPDVCVDCVDQAINLALDLQTLFKNQSVYSLGRSPIFFVDILKMLQPNHADTEFDYIPFSGRYFAAYPKSYTEVEFLSCNEEIKKIMSNTGGACQSPPNEKEKAAYKKYLSKKGLDPQTIVNKFSKTNKLVLTDFSSTSAGVRSFLDFIRQWAREIDPQLENKLINSIHLHLILRHPTEISIEQHNMLVISNQFYDFSMSKTFLSKGQNLLLNYQPEGFGGATLSYGLAEAHDSKNYKETSFGSSFKITQWRSNKPIEMDQENSKGLYLTRMKFVDQLYKRGLIPNLSNTTNQCIANPPGTYGKINERLKINQEQAVISSPLATTTFSSGLTVSGVFDAIQSLLPYAAYAMSFFSSQEPVATATPALTKAEKKELRREEIQLERKARKTGKSVTEVAQEKIQDQEIRGKFGI